MDGNPVLYPQQSSASNKCMQMSMQNDQVSIGWVCSLKRLTGFNVSCRRQLEDAALIANLDSKSVLELLIRVAC